MQGWAGVDSVLARRTGATVVAYDRAGFRRSGLVVAEGSRHLIAKERPETIVEGVVSLMAAARE